jgi:hypothetical protein
MVDVFGRYYEPILKKGCSRADIVGPILMADIK